MKLFRKIPVYAAAAVLIAGPALSNAQTAQPSESSTQAAKKARKKVKKTEQQAGDAAATMPSNTPETPAARPKGEAAGSAHRAVPTVSDSEIGAAKAAGKVWVNTETGVYHRGGRWYGATRQGKFMTEDDAIKAGYRASKSKEE